MNEFIIAKLNVGDKVGRLKILEIIPGRNNPRVEQKAKCMCDCGTECFKGYAGIRYGTIKSCGCLALETRTTHGLSKTPEYIVWRGMRNRCSLKTDVAYKSYGGRGVTVCDRWQSSFQNFIDDMGKRPSRTHSIDRINNNGNYEPSNCRWATHEQQQSNRSNTREPVIKTCQVCHVKFTVRHCVKDIRKNCSRKCRDIASRTNK